MATEPPLLIDLILNKHFLFKILHSFQQLHHFYFLGMLLNKQPSQWAILKNLPIKKITIERNTVDRINFRESTVDFFTYCFYIIINLILIYTWHLWIYIIKINNNKINQTNAGYKAATTVQKYVCSHLYFPVFCSFLYFQEMKYNLWCNHNKNIYTIEKLFFVFNSIF